MKVCTAAGLRQGKGGPAGIIGLYRFKDSHHINLVFVLEFPVSGKILEPKEQRIRR